MLESHRRTSGNCLSKSISQNASPTGLSLVRHQYQFEITAKFNKEILAFQSALNEKISILISSLSMLLTALIISFVYGWLMTLVLLTALVAIFIAVVIYGLGYGNNSLHKAEVMGKAGAMVEQAIRAIKTVKQLNGQDYESERYSQSIRPLRDKAPRLSAVHGIGAGLLYAFLLLMYALGMWFASHCIVGDSVCPSSLNGGEPYSLADVFIIYFALQLSVFMFIQFSPAIGKIIEGRVAAAYIYRIIDRQPTIQQPQQPKIIHDFKGVFRFENVTFAYPKSKDKPVLQNISFQINCANSALVGDSGCGKSTIFQLMMRFYDPDQGKITLDGVDLRQLSLTWLRSQIGYVGQQPILFAMSLRDNLLCGSPDATNQALVNSMTDSESYAFVSGLKDKLDTYAGTGGREISGGQKQRLAIARVLLKNPRILLLDEATSALDRTHENLIQMTLNQIAKARVTISIAHRINTIQNCDQILVIGKGKILEQGRFSELERFSRMSKALLTSEQFQSELTQLHSRRSKNRNTDWLQRPSQSSVVDKLSNNNKLQAEEQAQDRLKSQFDQDDQLDVQVLRQHYQSEAIHWRIFLFCSYKCFMAIALFFSCLHGLTFPFVCIFIAKFNAALYSYQQTQTDDLRSDLNFYSLVFVLFAIGQFFLNFFLHVLSFTASESVTYELRKTVYQKMLKMPVSWLESTRRTSSSVVNLLNIDCQNINGFFHSYIGLLVQILSGIIGGIIISVVFEWRIGLIATALLPFILFAGAFRSKSPEANKDIQYEKVNHHISQAVIFIRTVHAIQGERMFIAHQEQLLEKPMQQAVKSGLFNGFLYGLSQLFTFFSIGLIFHLGAVIAKEHNLEISDVLTSLYIFVIGGLVASNKIQFMPQSKQISDSMIKTLHVLDSEDQDQLQVKQQSRMITTPIKGDIQFQKVTFSYQDRETLLNNFSLSVSQGQKIGIVGHSGSGKSTIMQLLLRFYEPKEGRILIDEVDIRDYDLHHLRGSLGVVQQQPVLFNESIAYNVAYNLQYFTDDNIISALEDAQLSRREWEQVAAVREGEANHELSKMLLERNVGVQGSQLSGGQKQRIAIARSMLRNPSVLLFDEATSALDAQNEMKVQSTLDRMGRERTTLTVAHRIHTIQKANRIMLMNKGRIIEEGTYAELIQARGAFYQFEKGLLEQ